MKHILLALLLVATVHCLYEIPMKHKERSPRDAKMFLAYMNRDPIIEKVTKLIHSMFPEERKPDLYSYPEEKIYNYLDAQYYG